MTLSDVYICTSGTNSPSGCRMHREDSASLNQELDGDALHVSEVEGKYCEEEADTISFLITLSSLVATNDSCS